MKSKFKSLLLAAAAVMLFAGCSNVALENARVEDSDAGDKCVLSISIADSEGLSSHASQRSARTIAPDTYDAGDDTTFKIEGKSARGYELTLQSIAFTGNTSTTEIALEYDVWYLTLHAYDNGVEVLKGLTTVDLRKTNSVPFILSSKGVSSDGSLELVLTVTSTQIKSYESGLYDVNTGALVKALTSGNVTPPDPVITITGTGIAPGSYIIKFIPYNDSLTSTSKESLNTWSDVIVIAPGRQTTGAKTVSGLLEPPSKPKDFTVSLVAASEDDYDNFYTVELSWIDDSTNEENFALNIYNKDTGTATLVKTFNGNFYGDSQYWVEGTLGMSTTSCKVKLPTGHLYEMELAAVNRAGTSDVAPRVASADFNTVINRKKITYNLMGASYSGQSEVVRYETYPNTDGFTLWAPAADAITFNGNNFTGWVADVADTTTITSLANDYKDETVYATFRNKPSFTFDIKNEDTTTLTVTATSASTAVTQNSNTFVVDTASGSGVWGDKITFTITNTGITSVDSMKVLINGNSLGNSSHSKTCNVTLSHFKNGGDFPITVICTVGDKTYSCDPQVFTFDVK